MSSDPAFARLLRASIRSDFRPGIPKLLVRMKIGAVLFSLAQQSRRFAAARDPHFAACFAQALIHRVNGYFEAASYGLSVVPAKQ